MLALRLGHERFVAFYLRLVKRILLALPLATVVLALGADGEGTGRREASSAGPMRLGIAGETTRALEGRESFDVRKAGGQAPKRTSLEAATLREVNSVRRRRGLKPLRFSVALRRAALVHSRALARHGYFDHASPQGGSWWRRIRRFYPVLGSRHWAVGENLLWSEADLKAKEVVALWMQSPKHKAILLDRDWREAGVGVFKGRAKGVFGDRRVMIVTADFGRR